MKIIKGTTDQILVPEGFYPPVVRQVMNNLLRVCYYNNESEEYAEEQSRRVLRSKTTLNNPVRSAGQGQKK